MKKFLPLSLIFVSLFVNAEQTNILASNAFSACTYVSAGSASIAYYQVNNNVYVNESKVELCPTQLFYKTDADGGVIYQLSVATKTSCKYSQSSIGDVTCKLSSK